MDKNRKRTNEKATWDSLALDIVKRLKATERAKDWAIFVLGMVAVVIAIALSLINYKNDCDWRNKEQEVIKDVR